MCIKLFRFFTNAILKRLIFSSKAISFVLILGFSSAATEVLADKHAEIILVENPNTGSFTRNDPVKTLFMKGAHSKALILVLPGGDGMFNFQPGVARPSSSFGQALRRLTDKDASSGAYDVVIMDSPYSLHVNGDGFTC